MHELFTQVLTKKDLSKVIYVYSFIVKLNCFLINYVNVHYLLQAGDLFSVDDKSIIQDLSEVIHKIREIIHLSEYKRNANDQSVVEICITRVTSAIRLVFFITTPFCI